MEAHREGRILPPEQPELSEELKLFIKNRARHLDQVFIQDFAPEMTAQERERIDKAREFFDDAGFELFDLATRYLLDQYYRPPPTNQAQERAYLTYCICRDFAEQLRQQIFRLANTKKPEEEMLDG